MNNLQYKINKGNLNHYFLKQQMEVQTKAIVDALDPSKVTQDQIFRRSIVDPLDDRVRVKERDHWWFAWKPTLDGKYVARPFVYQLVFPEHAGCPSYIYQPRMKAQGKFNVDAHRAQTLAESYKQHGGPKGGRTAAPSGGSQSTKKAVKSGGCGRHHHPGRSDVSSSATAASSTTRRSSAAPASSTTRKSAEEDGRGPKRSSRQKAVASSTTTKSAEEDGRGPKRSSRQKAAA